MKQNPSPEQRDTDSSHGTESEELYGSQKRIGQGGETSGGVQQDGRTSDTEDTPDISALGKLRRKILTSKPASATKEVKTSPGCREINTRKHTDRMAARVFKGCHSQLGQ